MFQACYFFPKLLWTDNFQIDLQVKHLKTVVGEFLNVYILKSTHILEWYISMECRLLPSKSLHINMYGYVPQQGPVDDAQARHTRSASRQHDDGTHRVDDSDDEARLAMQDGDNNGQDDDDREGMQVPCQMM
jgi:hypothetical protein